MKILHLLSQTELTGAEAYAVDLAEVQKSEGKLVWIISDKIHLPTKLPIINLPISKRRYTQRFRNILALRKFILENKIDVIHSHSRAASWIAYYASLGTKTAYVSTVHGRQHLHLSLKLKDIYGQKVFAVCENLKTHLVQEVGMDEKKIVVLPNGVRLLDNPPQMLERAKRRLTILGRTSGPKGQRTEFLLQNVVPFLMEADPELEIQIAGGPLNNFSVETIAKIQSLKTTYRSRFMVRESLEMEEVNKVLATSTFVIGSGRVGMKALWQNTPLFAVGESLCHGWVTPANYQEVCASNFGDISARENQIEELSANRLLTMIREGLYSNAVSAEDSKLLQKYTLQRFGIRILNSSLNHEYRKVILKKRIPSWIPILMYHKLVESPLDSSHRIFLEKNKFEKHLASLKGRGYQTITFEQIEEFMAGNKSWDQFPKKPVMITFDDGYKEALNYAVPALQNHGYHGVFYVLGNPDLALNEWDMKEGEPAESLIDHSSLLKLSQAGHEIGAHSYSHPRLTDISLDEVSMEAQKSKEVLRDRIGKEPVSFAYPYGNHNEFVKKMIADTGYRFGISTDSGGLHLADDPMQVFRVSIFPEDEGFQFWKKTHPWYRRYYQVKRGK